MYTYLLFGITYAFAAAVQPGPLQTYIISQTIKKGWRSTLPASFAPVISDGPIILSVLFLLSNVSDNFIFILRMDKIDIICMHVYHQILLNELLNGY